MEAKSNGVFVIKVVLITVITMLLMLGLGFSFINSLFNKEAIQLRKLLEEDASAAVVALPPIKKLDLPPEFKYQVECYSGPRVIVDPINTNELELTDSGYIVFVYNNQKVSVKSNCMITENLTYKH